MMAMIIILVIAIMILISVKIYETGYDDGTKETERAYRFKACHKCANYKTIKCPNTSKCFSTIDKPYFKIKEDKEWQKNKKKQ